MVAATIGCLVGCAIGVWLGFLLGQMTKLPFAVTVAAPAIAAGFALLVGLRAIARAADR